LPLIFRSKKFHKLFALYWFLLAYIVAALIFWFVTLNRQNNLMAEMRTAALNTASPAYQQELGKITRDRQRKVSQYKGEGVIFLLVIIAGAYIVYRAVKKQLKISSEQQHFMMAITHELKTPIAVAQLNLETIQKRKLDDDQQQRLLQNTLHETTRLNTLCNNLLLSSQLDASGYKLTNIELDFTALVESSVADMRRRFPNRQINSELEEQVILDGDSMLLQMLVNNLLENALKYSPKEKPVDIKLAKLDNMIRMEVLDQGPGIDPHDKKKAFEKFHRLGNEATRRAKGTGLGLYLCKKIVKTHGGSIDVADNPGGGSIFTVELKPSE
jgi:two-component system sensor histidine kinase CiaH